MATLLTVLKLDGTGFSRGLKSASREVQLFHKEIGKPLAQGVGNLLKLAAAAGTAAVGLVALNAIKMSGLADALDKASTRTGVNAQELARYQYAASLAGTTLDTFEVAIKASANAMGMARDGNKEMAETLASVGLRYSDLKGMDPAQTFETILGAVSQTTDATNRSIAATRLLGKAGKDLLPMAANLSEIKSQADGLGIVFTPEQIAASVRFQDSITTLKAAFTGLLMSGSGFDVMSNAMQALTQRIVALRTSEGFQDWVRSVKSWGTTLVHTLFGVGEAIVTFVRVNADNLLKFASIFSVVVIAFKTGLAVPLLKMAASLSKGLITSFFTPVGASVAALIGAFLALEASAVSIATGVSFKDAFKAVTQSMGNTIKDFGKSMFNFVVPDSVKQFMEDIGNAGEFTFPAMPEFKLAGIEGGVERGVVAGMNRNQFGRVFTGALGNMTEQKRSTLDEKQLKAAEASAKAGNKTAASLEIIARKKEQVW